MNDIFVGIGRPLSATGFKTAADNLGGDSNALWSLIAVETRGFGYLPDRRPKILFERHVFHARTGGKYSSSNPDISNAAPGGYLGGAEEYQRLKRAMLLDRRHALESASWGLGQVMGFNAAALNYPDVDALIEAFKESEDKQLLGCAAFINARSDLGQAFKDRDWARVAFFYNGRNFAANSYDTKLDAAYRRYSDQAPNLNVRTGQACLAYLGFGPLAVDGIAGDQTLNALRKFLATQQSKSKPSATPASPLEFNATAIDLLNRSADSRKFHALSTSVHQQIQPIVVMLLAVFRAYIWEIALDDASL